MPTINGLEATLQLKERGLAGRVIILTLYDEYLTQAIEAGAGGYLVKNLKQAELVNAIRRVHKGEMVLGTGLLDSPSHVEAALKRLQEMVTKRPNRHLAHSPSTPSARSPSQSSHNDGSHATAEGQQATSPDLAGLNPSRPLAPTSPIGKEPPPLSAPEEHQPTQPPPPHANGTSEATNPSLETPLQETIPEAVPPEETPLKTLLQEEGTYHSDEDVELILLPPVDPARLFLLSRKLIEEHDVEVLETAGSWQGGTWLRIMLRRPLALKRILSQLPEIVQVWEATPEERRSFAKEGVAPAHLAKPGPQVSLVVKMAGAPVQLTLTL